MANPYVSGYVIISETTVPTLGIELTPPAISEKLYNKLRAIQYGDEADPYGWVMIVE